MDGKYPFWSDLCVLNFSYIQDLYSGNQGRIQDFKLGGGGRGALNFFWGYFVWKIMILRQKIIFFPILGAPPPPGSAPGNTILWNVSIIYWNVILGIQVSLLSLKSETL